MQFKYVTLDIDGPVAILKLDHQEVMNAVSIDMLGGLAETAQHIDRDRVHHLLMVELQDGDRAVDVERDVFELHLFPHEL